MSVAGLLISLVLSLIALVIVARPLLRVSAAEREGDEDRQRRRDGARTYYERVLTNIRDLDEDFATGKIGRDDYEGEREFWAQRGLRLLRALDQRDAGDELLTTADHDDQIDRAIEAAVAAYRADGAIADARAGKEDLRA